VFVELRMPQPMLEVRLFKDRLFRGCNITSFVAFIGFSGSLFLLPIMLQAERGMSPFQSGLTTFPQALGVMFAAQPVSRFYMRIGPRRLIIAGLTIAAVTSFLFMIIDFETNQWWIRLIMFGRGLGFGFMIIPMQAGTFSNIPQAMAGRASSFYSSSRMIAQSFGVAILTLVLTSRLNHYGSHLQPVNTLPAAVRDQVSNGALKAFHQGFAAAGVAAIIGIFVTLWLIRDKDAAASMRRAPVGPPARGAEPAAVPAGH
jgi:MFS family permease